MRYKKYGHKFLSFCHNARVWQTDGETDAQTFFSWLIPPCIVCIAVKMRTGHRNILLWHLPNMCCTWERDIDCNIDSVHRLQLWGRAPSKGGGRADTLHLTNNKPQTSMETDGSYSTANPRNEDGYCIAREPRQIQSPALSPITHGSSSSSSPSSLSPLASSLTRSVF